MERQPFLPTRLVTLFDEIYEASEHPSAAQQIKWIMETPVPV